MDPVMVIAGTRPETIKLSPVIKWLQKLRMNMIFTWSGQHYDYELSKVFFEQLDLPEPDVNLDIKSGSHSKQTAKAMIRLEKTIAQYKPSLVVAEGDTNTVAAAALTAIKTYVPFAHVEAGLRSYDRTMPEEINRMVADSLSELLFAPTKLAVMNLTHEGIPLRKIHLTGNPIVDVVIEHKDTACRKSLGLLERLNLVSGGYLLVTLHRQENTDNPSRLINIVKALLLLSERYKIVFPMHPRTKSKLKRTGLYETFKDEKSFTLFPPLGYFEFLGLLFHSLAVLTDSGGVQEEALTLGVPTVTLRYNTERPETVLYGANVLAGTEPEFISKLTENQVKNFEETRNNLKMMPNPFGDGNAGRRIAVAIKNAVEAGIKIEASDTRHDPMTTYARNYYLSKDVSFANEVANIKSILNGKRIFVTGANGFVGSNLCGHLLIKNAEVTAFVRKSTTSKPTNIIHLQNRLRISFGDLRDFKTLCDATKEMDIIYHLGAQSHIPDGVKEPFGTFQVNAVGTLNCLEAARMNDVDLFVNAGSDKIYGDPLYLPLDERHPLRPRSPYDASKVASESLCMVYHKTYGLKVCLPRFSNIYGPRQDRRKVIPDFISYLLQGKPPIIRSDGTPVRDYIFIDDVVKAYLGLVGEPKAVGEIINFGTGVGTSVLDLCQLLIDVSNLRLRPTILSKYSPGEIQQQYLDISKAKKLLDWSPCVDLRKGLSLTWEWYKAHPEFFEVS